jgi:hypothetical protein
MQGGAYLVGRRVIEYVARQPFSELTTLAWEDYSFGTWIASAAVTVRANVPGSMECRPNKRSSAMHTAAGGEMPAVVFHHCKSARSFRSICGATAKPPAARRAEAHAMQVQLPLRPQAQRSADRGDADGASDATDATDASDTTDASEAAPNDRGDDQPPGSAQATDLAAAASLTSQDGDSTGIKASASPSTAGAPDGGGGATWGDARADTWGGLISPLEAATPRDQSSWTAEV